MDQLFAQPYAATSRWVFVVCDGAAGSTYCTWVDKFENSLVLRIDNATQKVTSARRIGLGSNTSGQFFHAWRQGKQADAATFGTNAAVTALFATTYDAADHWVPQGCELNAAESTRTCTWAAGDGRRVQTVIQGAGPLVKTAYVLPAGAS